MAPGASGKKNKKINHEKSEGDCGRGRFGIYRPKMFFKGVLKDGLQNAGKNCILQILTDGATGKTKPPRSEPPNKLPLKTASSA
ncbi:hypothetical protein FACS1894124_2240 [Spirochaetia bacterium]|nr:hypothetical protein FACS1894124_2240 [Spirochaetia bacterium]